MKKILIIGIIVMILVVVIGTVVIVLSNEETSTTNTTNTSGTTITNDQTNTNSAQRVVIEESGPIAIGKSMTYRGIEFSIASAAELDSYHRQDAPAGKKFVVLFVEPITTADEDISSWLATETKLRSSTGTEAVFQEVQMVSDASSTNVGHFWFVADNGEHNFRLIMAATNQGQAEAFLDLGF